MSEILKILKKIENSETQSLRIEVSSALLEGLNIQPDGTVDLEALMQLCQRLMRVKSLKAKAETAKDSLPDQWRDKIFNHS